MTLLAFGGFDSVAAETVPVPQRLTPFERTKAKAEKGDPTAEGQLAWYYFAGIGVSKNEVKAAKWFRKAAEQGDADAQSNLGGCYDGGCGLTRDETEAAKWYRKAADQGNTTAQLHLGAMYEKGEGVETNFAEAAELFREAAENGSAPAQYALGRLLLDGIGVQQNRVEATRWFQSGAKQGDAQSEFALGLCYSQGNGVSQNFVEAYKWYSVAAAQGLTNAVTSRAGVAAFFMTPEQIAKGQQLAAEFKPTTAMSAVSPVPSITSPASPWTPAQNSRGEYHFLNDLMTPFSDLPAAVQEGILKPWRKQFADEGFNVSDQELIGSYTQAQMGDTLALIGGKTKSQQKSPSTSSTSAAFLETKARADAGDTAEETALGGIYYGGSSVPQDYAEAAKWFRKAAEQGNPRGQFALALCYVKGQGIPEDYVEAYKWFNLAAAQNVTEAIYDRHNLVNSMTPAQIAEGQRLSREFVPRKEGGAESVADGQDSAAVENVPRFTGTGFFVTDNGYLLTAFHVVADASRIAIRTDVGTVAAMLVKADKANDVALLKVTGTFSTLPVASSRGAKLGESVFTIGFPNIELQGLTPKLTKGEISSLAGMRDDPSEFQISVPVQPGNSGGPLVNQYGNVVGVVEAQLADITTLKTTGSLPQNVNYAVKSSLLLSFLESVPDVDAKLKAPNTADEKFEEVVKSAQAAAVLVLVY
jgi:hypothetical protein